jgi:hypothetical protein
MRNLSAALVMSVIAALALAAGAGAGGGGAQTLTFHEHQATDTFQEEEGECGIPIGSQIAITYNSVFHVTIRPGGSFDFDTFEGTNFSLTGTQSGTATVVTPAPESKTYTGHFATWFGGSVNNQSASFTDTFNAHLTAADGSTIRIHENEHFNLSASGHMNDFFKQHCG